jgi:hypothetical protein
MFDVGRIDVKMGCFGWGGCILTPKNGCFSA